MRASSEALPPTSEQPASAQVSAAAVLLSWIREDEAAGEDELAEMEAALDAVRISERKLFPR